MECENGMVLHPRAVKSYLDRVTGPKLAPIGLSTGTAPFIIAISKKEGVNLKGLSESLMVDKAHSTRMVSKLIEDGLAENRAEGHAYSIYLTEEGRHKSQQVEEILNEAWAKVFSTLTPEEVETMKTVVGKINDVISGEEQ